MKTTHKIILILAVITAALCAMSLPCEAEEKEGNSIWVEDKQTDTPGRFELTEERIERIMKRLAETEPQKAEKLEQLRKEDPEKFKTELRNVMRERFHQGFRGRKEQGFGPPGAPNMPEMRGMPGMQGMPGMGGMGGMAGMPAGWGGMGRQTECLEWIEKNYPDEAKNLAELKKGKPELYWRKLGLYMRKYGRIAEASKDNPKLAEALKKDLDLRQQQDALLAKIEAASGDEKQKLITELEGVVSSRFDLIVERKQIEYEQLTKKLEQLKEEIEQNKAQVEKWKDAGFKNENVKARVEELLSRGGKFEWE